MQVNIKNGETFDNVREISTSESTSGVEVILESGQSTFVVNEFTVTP